MTKLPVHQLIEQSRPVVAEFWRIAPKPWDSHAILLELIGEIGSLAHLVQKWEGFKKGKIEFRKLNDELADVLFVTLQYAIKEELSFNEFVEPSIAPHLTSRPTIMVIELCSLAIDIHDSASKTHTAEKVLEIINVTAKLAQVLGVNLERAFTLEMAIAMQFFQACGDKWPNPQLFQNPIETFRLWRLMGKRKRLKP